MGFRLFKEMNQGLLSTLGWNLATNANKLWKKLLLEKYCFNISFMNVSPNKKIHLYGKAFVIQEPS